MTPSRRLIIAFVMSSALTIETAALICVPLGLSANWLTVVCVASGPFWAWAVDWAIGKAETAWKGLQNAPRAVRDGDGPALLALFAMRAEPTHLIGVVLVLNPCPDGPSWLHSMRRWNVMSAWAMRTGELMAEADRLANAGLLRCTERGRRYRGMSMYEATELGRDVAARNAEVLMAELTEERA
jgi:hypothetical protein